MQDFGLRSLVAALALSLPVWPAAAGHPGADPAKVEARIQQAIERLDLTADQQARLKPVVQEHVAQMKALRAKYPAEPSREQKRELFQEVRAMRDDYDTKVRAVLTEEQQKKWQEMRQEGRERMRHEMKHRHDDASAPEQPTG
jgi:protein CpxP